MTMRLLATGVMLLATAGLAGAQVPAPAVSDTPADNAGSPGTWASVDYLLWWVKSSRLPPLVTAGNPAAGAPVGALGAPGTVVLNPLHQAIGPVSGGRLTLGTWLDADQTVGVEVSGFLTEERRQAFAASAGPAAGSILAIPFVNTPPVAPTLVESALPLNGVGGASGTAQVVSSIGLWGAEANGLWGIANTGTQRVVLLGGVRYLDLLENLDLAFANNPFGIGLDRFDHFGTRNQIYAGQFGARFQTQFDRFFISLTGKLGLGDNHATVDVQGTRVFTTPTLPGFPPVSPGGFFAQPTNIGRHTREEFVVIPEVRVQAGLDLTANLRVQIGYDFLYLSNVVRPGDQIDRAVNTTQFFGAPLVGPAHPAPLFRTSDFWAQGISAGLTLKF